MKVAEAGLSFGDSPDDKELGAYYTPSSVVHCLVDWAIEGLKNPTVLDPSCGDGRFLRHLGHVRGVDVDPTAIRAAKAKIPAECLTTADFFAWAARTKERFDCAVGNPPFIRYQRFSGAVRARARELCAKSGIQVSGLASSWAPFVVGASSLLRRGGRVGFVVPAEVAYAVYARPVVEWLLDNFGFVEVVAVREKLFPHLSEDCWLIRASGFGGRAEDLQFTRVSSLAAAKSDWSSESVPRAWLERLSFRLRSLLLPLEHRRVYERLAASSATSRLGDVARVGIGYVSGANDFFHLRPTEARKLGIPQSLLRPAVRSNRDLAGLRVLDEATIERWTEEDRPFLLLDLNGVDDVPSEVKRYLDSKEGWVARSSYKCRSRPSWYVVPDVRVPSAFLSIMSGDGPRFVANLSGAVCTNSVHAVEFYEPCMAERVLADWPSLLSRLSCELEGHALGGGMLKLEPKEARAVLVTTSSGLQFDRTVLEAALREIQIWRGLRHAS